MEAAERAYDLNRMSELKYGKLPELQKKLKEEEAIIAAKSKDNRLLKEEVGEEDIAQVVSRWTGHPGDEDADGRAREAAAPRRCAARPCRRPG